MDRKGIIGIAVAIIVLVVWQIYYSREMARYQEEQRAIAAATAASQPAQAPVAAAPGATPAPTATPGTAGAPVPAVPAAPATPAVEEKLQKLSSPSVEYTFSNLGGGIARATLLKHVAEHGKVQGDEIKVALNQLGQIPIGTIAESAGQPTKDPFTASVNEQAGQITFDRTDARQLQTVKQYTLPQGTAMGEEYNVQLEVTFTNRGAQPIQLPQYFVHTGVAAPIHKNDQAFYTGLSYYDGDELTFKDVSKFTSGGVMGFGADQQPYFSAPVPNLTWAGVANQYFTTIITPQGAKGSGVMGHKFSAENVTLVGSAEKVSVDAVEGGLGMSGFTLAPGQSVSQKFSIFAGPREYQRLKALGAEQEKIMDFGMFAFVSKFLLGSMNWLNSKLGSFAAAIIVLTIFIKLALWPLQNKATNSMKKMQALQPKMTELREKYKDDPTRMNTELMKLYKDYGVNPFGGCLPMLIQIPIFFGFYNMLGKAVELRNSQFLWVRDLSQPDTVAMLPGLDFPINILPLLMAGTMLWQMAISPKSGDPMQQRIFMFMPLIFVFFCYNFASALALYWTVQNVFSIVQLYLTRNQATPSLQKVVVPVKKKKRD